MLRNEQLEKEMTLKQKKNIEEEGTFQTQNNSGGGDIWNKDKQFKK